MRKQLSPAAQLGQWLDQTADHICVNLLEHSYISQEKIQADLIERNEALGGRPEGFMHRGKMVVVQGTGTLYGKAPLHESLVPEANAWFDAAGILVRDRQKLKQSLLTVMAGCRSWPDLRDALPDSLVPYLTNLEGHPRTRPVYYTILNNELKMLQVPALEELINFYIGTRMIL